jgi:hypothetical protein
MSARPLVDDTRPRPHRTDCFEDDDGRPIVGTPPPRPCPFCGSGPDELVLMASGKLGAAGTVHFVLCLGCECEGPNGKTQLEAAQRWNRPSRVWPS